MAELAVWLEDEDGGEDDPSPPSDGSCNAGYACCKEECKDGCKEIGEGGNEQSGEDEGNGSDPAEMDLDSQRSFATSSGSHSSPGPAPQEIHRHRMQVRSVPCGSRTVANETIENCDPSSNQKHLSALTSSSAKRVCNTVCTPLCNTVANGVRPLSGVLDPRTFARVRVEIGRCDICSAAKAVYRSREAQTNVCEGCYSRLVREWNGRAGVWGTRQILDTLQTEDVRQCPINVRYLAGYTLDPSGFPGTWPG